MKKIFLILIIGFISFLPLVAQGQENTSAPTKHYKIGDYYNSNGLEGVVFQVDESGMHGKIVSLKESVARMKWATFPKEQKRFLGAIDHNDGRNNQAIIKSIPGWQEKFPPITWCAEQGEKWYLPAINELEIFVKEGIVHSAVNKTLAQLGAKQLAKRGEFRWYWSSTEHLVKRNAAQVYCLYVSDNKVAEWKYIVCYVRAIATF
jgi:hypothetical protein